MKHYNKFVTYFEARWIFVPY